MDYTKLKDPHVTVHGFRDVSPESTGSRIPLDHYPPPAGPPPLQENAGFHKKNESPFENDVPPVKNWPQSQNVATLTPLRIFIVVFDAILASTPIMFIGNHIEQAFVHSYADT